MKSLIVTGAHHRAVCALYEKQLEQQRGDWKDDIAALTARAEKSEARVQELHAKVLEMMTAKETPAAAGPHGEPARRKERVKVPEAVDPNNAQQLFAQAYAEVGGGSGNRVLRRMEQIRERMRPTGPRMQDFKAPDQADVQKMIDNAEYLGLTMDPITQEVE